MFTGQGVLAICALVCALSAAPGWAEPVKLTARGTGFTVTGELLDFDGARYRIASPIGVLTIPASETDCAGASCPPPPPAGDPDLIAGGGELAGALVSGLFEAMAFASGGAAERREESGSGAVRLSAPLPGGEIVQVVVDPAAEDPGAAITFRWRRAGEVAPSGPVIALDALALLVAPGSPATSMSLDAARKVLAGEVSNWSSLGGPDAPIALHLPAAGPGAAALAEFLDEGASPAPGAIYHASFRSLSDAVAGDPAALGFATLAFERNARALAIELECGLVAEPGAFSVKAGDHPFLRRLVATSGPAQGPGARAFFDFASSEEAQEEIAAFGAIDQQIETLPLNAQGRRIADGFLKARLPAATALMSELAGRIVAAERLSLTLNFAPGSEAPLEAGADFARLTRAAADGAFTGRELLLLGFADDAAGFADNISLAVRRAEASAEAARSAFAAAGMSPPRIVTGGYGPVAPVSCPGRAAGRRVEVWSRPAAGP